MKPYFTPPRIWRALFVAGLLSWQTQCASPLLAQTTDPTANKAPTPITNYTSLADHAMRFLDMSGAETGIVCDRMISWEGATAYYSEEPAGGVAGFAQMWRQLYGSTLDILIRDNMLPPHQLRGRIMRHTQPAVIPVGIIHYDYNMLDPAALDRGTLTWDAANTALSYNRSVPGPIFVRRSVVYPSILSPVVRRNQPFTLKFTRELFFHNNPIAPIVSVKVSFYNGSYWHEVSFPISELANGDYLVHFNLGRLEEVTLTLTLANGDSRVYFGNSGLTYID